MITPVASFLTNKCLQEIWSYLENSFKNAVSLEQVSEIINDKLDVLRNAPYKAALIYLREGKVDKFREKIIDTMSVDEFNLIAQLAYIKLLIAENEYQIALEQYWNIMDKFGCMHEIIPDLLIDEYVKKNHRNILFPKSCIFLSPGYRDSLFGKFHVVELWMSRGLFVAKWKKPKSSWFFFSKNHLDRYIVTVSNANSRQILNFKDKNVEVINVTNIYVALRVGCTLKLFNTNGEEIKTISEYQIETLFGNSLFYNKFVTPFNVKTIGDLSFKLSEVLDTETRTASGVDRDSVDYEVEYKLPIVEIKSTQT